jgi:hypothetical protein
VVWLAVIVDPLLRFLSSVQPLSPWFLVGQAGGGDMKISVQAKEAEGRAKPTVLVLPGTNKDGVGEDRSTIDGRKTQTLGGIVSMPARIRFLIRPLIRRQILTLTLTLVGRRLRLQV